MLACSFALGLTRALDAQTGADDVRGLPLMWIEPTGALSHRVVIVLSGDGGFAELVTHLGKGLASRGFGVVGFNSRAFLSPKKSPDETAAAVARVVRAAMARWKGDSIVLIGYSRGADLAPFVANRMPTDLHDRVSAIAMFGLARMANFEFHWTDLVKDTPRDSDVPILPELLRLRGLPMVCVYGEDEPTSGCRDAPDDLLRKEPRKGGHHFDGDLEALVETVLRLLGRPSGS